jgi:hypothetical protein
MFILYCKASTLYHPCNLFPGLSDNCTNDFGAVYDLRTSWILNKHAKRRDIRYPGGFFIVSLSTDFGASIELPVFLGKVEAHSSTYKEFLHEILSFEENKSEEKTIEKYLKWAKFPCQKSLGEVDLKEHPSLSDRQLRQLQELSWLEQPFNLIFLSPRGLERFTWQLG